MKCFLIAIFIQVLLFYRQPCQCQEISLDALSLISSQLDFLEDMCLNRTGNETAFEKLHETIEECQQAFLNGTSPWLVIWWSHDSRSEGILWGLFIVSWTVMQLWDFCICVNRAGSRKIVKLIEIKSRVCTMSNVNKLWLKWH